MLYLLGNYENTTVKMDAADEALHKDVRMLMGMLGNAIRDVEGKRFFYLIETLRKLSVRFYNEKDHSAQAEMESILRDLSDDDMNKVISTVGYFSTLANIVEDHHHIRRWRAHQLADSPPCEGSLEASIALAREHGFDNARLKEFFNTADISPVLTAPDRGEPPLYS
jgi:phosphoenolpyruvate carboxylase